MSEKAKRSSTYSKAVEFFDKALLLDPKNAYAAMGIAIAVAEEEKDVKSALPILIKVRETVVDAVIRGKELREHRQSRQDFIAMTRQRPLLASSQSYISRNLENQWGGFLESLRGMLHVAVDEILEELRRAIHQDHENDDLVSGGDEDEHERREDWKEQQRRLVARNSVAVKALIMRALSRRIRVKEDDWTNHVLRAHFLDRRA